MLDQLLRWIKQYPRICILGMGKEGWSTYRFIRKFLPQQQLFLADRIVPQDFTAETLSNDPFTASCFGPDYCCNLERFDLIFKAPGISFHTLECPAVKDKLTSQTDVFLRFYKHRTIGITGTKGKSTTASLIYQCLKDANLPVHLAGNIGKPVLDLLEEFNASDWMVLECSSHQLEWVHDSPCLAVFLNIFPEHLDYYKDYTAYQEAKVNIFRFQTSKDILFYYAHNPALKALLKKPAVSQRFSVQEIAPAEPPLFCVLQNGSICIYLQNKAVEYLPANAAVKLLGKHNRVNIAFAACLAAHFGVAPESFQKTVAAFCGLPHRLEYAGTYEGIHFYNDSISTIPETAVQAIEALETVHTLILGGFDRGLDYRDFGRYLAASGVKVLLFLPQTGPEIFKIVSESSNINSQHRECVSDLRAAVQLAKAQTPKGGVCLFSPAAASYHCWKNFEERGNAFKAYLQETCIK